MYAYRAYTQGWDTARKEKFIGHLLRIQAVLDAVGVPDVMPVCLVDAPPYGFAFEINARVERAEVYVSVIPQGRYSDDNIQTGKLGIPDPVVYEAFCSEHIPPGQGVGLYVNNEAHVWTDARVIFQWLADAGRRLAEVGHFAVLGNFATTWPTPEMLRLPEARAYMQTLADFPNLLRNGVHEYESDLKLRPHGAIGSYVKWIEACRYHELPTHDIIITEGPWDGVDGVSKGIAQVMALWQGSGEVKQFRAAREVVDMLKAHYIHPAVRGFCFYMWTGFIEAAATWRDFNVSEMDIFLGEMEKGLYEVALARKAMYTKLLEPEMPAEPEPPDEAEPPANDRLCEWLHDMVDWLCGILRASRR